MAKVPDFMSTVWKSYRRTGRSQRIILWSSVQFSCNWAGNSHREQRRTVLQVRHITARCSIFVIAIKRVDMPCRCGDVTTQHPERLRLRLGAGEVAPSWRDSGYDLGKFSETETSTLLRRKQWHTHRRFAIDFFLVFLHYYNIRPLDVVGKPSIAMVCFLDTRRPTLISQAAERRPARICQRSDVWL